MEADIVIECPGPYAYQVERWLAGKRGQNEADIVKRALEAGPRPELTLGDDCTGLMRAAVDVLNLSSDRINRILRLAQTIAALGHDDRIANFHLAEAIQYRPRL